MNQSSCRAVWTAQKSFHQSMLDAELEEFGPSSKCETKKTIHTTWARFRNGSSVLQ
jgi:hypothetical protein